MRNPIRGTRVWVWIVLAVAAVIVGALVWYARPMHLTDPMRLVPPEASALLPRLLPTRVYVWLAPGEKPSAPEVGVLVPLGNPLRLTRLAPRKIYSMLFGGDSVDEHRVGRHTVVRSQSGGGYAGLSSSAVVGNTMVLCSSSDLLTQAVSAYEAETTLPAWLHAGQSSLLRKPMDSFGILVTNTSGDLTDMVSAVESEYTFAAFPTINVIDTIIVDLRMAPVESQGSMDQVRSERYASRAWRFQCCPRRRREIWRS